MRPLTKISLFGVRLATCVLIVYWIALFAGTHVPAMPDAVARIPDKVMHFTGFFILAFLLCWVIPTKRHAGLKFMLVALIALSYGAFDEITQGLVRGRTTDINDFAADAAGILSAILIYATARHFYRSLFATGPVMGAAEYAAHAQTPS